VVVRASCVQTTANISHNATIHSGIRESPVKAISPVGLIIWLGLAILACLLLPSAYRLYAIGLAAAGSLLVREKALPAPSKDRTRRPAERPEGSVSYALGGQLHWRAFSCRQHTVFTPLGWPRRAACWMRSGR
jgi:hypothetical protein